jgi:schlafen family protein
MSLNDSDKSVREQFLRNILHRGFESKDLDYKNPCKWDEADKMACCRLVKDVLGMANTLGGFLVIGVSETATGFSWDGMSSEQNESFETTRFNRFLQNYADPPINTRLLKLVDDGRQFVIIEVPRFPDTPHLCQRDFPGALSAGTLYVRTDNNESAPIKSSADFRLVVEQAVRNRSDGIVDAIRSILKGGPSTTESSHEQFDRQTQEAVERYANIDPYRERQYVGYREATFRPAKFDASRYGLEQLKNAATQAHVDFRGWPFLFISPSRPDVTHYFQDGIETLIWFQDFLHNDRADFWRFYQSGLFYYRTLMREESAARRSDTKSFIDLLETDVHVAEAIVCLSRLYDGLLDDSDSVSCEFQVLGTDGRLLTSETNFLLIRQQCIARVPSIVVTRTLPLGEWRSSIVDHCVEISKEILLRFNWDSPSIPAVRQIVDRLLSRRL